MQMTKPVVQLLTWCISYLQEAVYNLLILTNVAQGDFSPCICNFCLSLSKFMVKL